MFPYRVSLFPISLACSSPAMHPEFAAEGPPGFVTARVRLDVNNSADAGALQIAPGREGHCTVAAQPGTTLASVTFAIVPGDSWTAGGASPREIEKHVEFVDNGSAGSPAAGQSHSFVVRAKDVTQGRITIAVPVRYR